MDDPALEEPGNPTTQIASASAVAVTAFFLFALDWRYGLNGAVTAVGAERVLAGEIPYRDFWTMYAPGHFYLNAFLQYLFGPHILVQAIAGSAVCSAAAGILFLIARGVGGITAGLACTAVFIAALYDTAFFKYLGSYPLAIFFALSVLYLIERYYRERTQGLLFTAGIGVGIISVAKHDVGGYTAIAVAAGLIADHVYLKFCERAGATFRSLAAKLALFATGIAVVALPVYLLFAVLAGKDMFQDLILFPLTDFPFSRPEQYPSLFPRGIRGSTFPRTISNIFRYLSFAIPFFLFVSGIVTTAVAFVRRRPVDFALGITFLTAFLLHYNAAHVQINTHIVSMSVYGGLLGALSLRVLKSVEVFRHGFAIPTGAAVAGIIWAASFAYPASLTYAKKWSESNSTLNLPKVNGIRLPVEDVRIFEELRGIVDSTVPAGDPIYIGLDRHDVLLIGDTMTYFILDRPSATRYQELHPAITDTAPVQLEMIDDIKTRKVRVVILKTIFNGPTLDRFKRDFQVTLPNIGAGDLDEYIRQNYVEIRRIGDYSVLVRRDSI